MDIKGIIRNKAPGFYVGAAGAVTALIALFVYIGMGSMYFSALVVVGILVGIVVFALSALFNIRIGLVLSYVCYMFGLYHFLTLEINYRMDSLIVYGLGGLDAIFVVATVFFLIAIIASIVGSCMKQNKDEAAA